MTALLKNIESQWQNKEILGVLKCNDSTVMAVTKETQDKSSTVVLGQ